MSTEAGFLSAILDDPADLTPRYIFADWLDDQNNSRGEFVRVQTELLGWVPDLERRTKLLRRQEQLLAQYEDEWLGPLRPLLKRWYWEGGLLNVTIDAETVANHPDREQLREWLTRAWVHWVRLEAMGKMHSSFEDLAALSEIRAFDFSSAESGVDCVPFLIRCKWMTKATELNLANNGNTSLSLTGILYQSNVLNQLIRLDLRNSFPEAHWIDLSLESSVSSRLRWLDTSGGWESPEEEQRRLEWCQSRDGYRDRFVNGIGMELTRIPDGSFLMGSPEDESQRFPDESPQHHVTISKPFYLGIYPVTQRQYEAIMGNNPSSFRSEERIHDHFPVDSVSWQDAIEFCRRLTAMPEERKAGRVYRLPAEAEWEHACRAGTDTPFPHPYYRNLSSHFANFDGTRPYGNAPQGPYLQRTSPVGLYPPTGFGLFDMMGNVWEWCADGREEDFYRQSPRIDPVAPTKGGSRICRGGSWYSPGYYLRSADRGSDHATVQAHYYGFRVACDVA